MNRINLEASRHWTQGLHNAIIIKIPYQWHQSQQQWGRINMKYVISNRSVSTSSQCQEVSKTKQWRNNTFQDFFLCFIKKWMLELVNTKIKVFLNHSHAFNLSTQESEADRFLSSRPAWSTKWIPGQPGLYRETLPWKTNKQTNKRINK